MRAPGLDMWEKYLPIFPTRKLPGYCPPTSLVSVPRFCGAGTMTQEFCCLRLIVGWELAHEPDYFAQIFQKSSICLECRFAWFGSRTQELFGGVFVNVLSRRGVTACMQAVKVVR